MNDCILFAIGLRISEGIWFYRIPQLLQILITMKEKNTYTTIRPARGVIGILVVIFLFQETVNAQTMNIHSQTAQQELATLGAGCFWCVEAIFQRVEGVLEVKSGYSGGQA